jgi:hypothetical protein
MVTREFVGADFGDERLSKRLVRLAEQFARAPDVSIPKAVGSEAAREATYRFLRNESVTPDAILAGHLAATLDRCRQAEAVLVLHDSSEFTFSGPREDLGRLSSDQTHGFLGHFALAIAARNRAPLGAFGFETITREHGTRQPAHRERLPASERESRRWVSLVEKVEAAIEGRFSAVHVMDREADSFAILAALRAKERRFIIRSQFDRAVVGEGERMGSVLGCAPVQLEREVVLPARVKRPKDVPSRAAKHPLREARTARLLVSSATVTISRPPGCDVRMKELTLNVVLVREADPPAGAEAVEWRLLTTEAVETAEDVAAVVDSYRGRWVIEEYFKALKSGCAFEQRQLESMRTLVNALAIFLPIAWQLLALRTLSRADDETPAENLLSPLKLKILRGHKDTRHMPCRTIRDAMLAIARLGGHIKSNGDPGWAVLGRGYEDLLMMELGALVASGSEM